MPSQTLEERFWGYVNKTPDCWLWTASVFTQTGYGQTWAWGHVTTAHQVAYQLTYGPVPDGLEIDHLCRVRACVRPTHLEAVTPKVNTLRSNSTSAHFARATHCKRNHPFDMFNTQFYINTFGRTERRCRTCRTERNKERYNKEV